MISQSYYIKVTKGTVLNKEGKKRVAKLKKQRNNNEISFKEYTDLLRFVKKQFRQPLTWYVEAKAGSLHGALLRVHRAVFGDVKMLKGYSLEPSTKSDYDNNLNAEEMPENIFED